MGQNAQRMVFLSLLSLLILQMAAAYAETPYSDSAFRTFISVSVNNSTVTAKITFLNITYFRKYNESALGQIDTTGELHKKGNYSVDNFTASVDPLNGSSLRFRFEGMQIAKPGGDIDCDPEISNEQGIANCEITHYKDGNGNVLAIADYKNCGYVEIKSDEMMRGSAKYPSTSQSAVVCPENSQALSAFGPAIHNAINDPSRLPICLPAMMIAGLLITAMYYSGRDPLSLFDITTPKLPKTQTFKVKMGQSPQMLRQVARRYAMIKKQARNDSVREIGRILKRAGKSDAEIKAAKKEMNSFYDGLDAAMKAGALSKEQSIAFREKYVKIMRKYKFIDKSESGTKEYGKFNKSVRITSSLLMTYLNTHAALKSMQDARSKAGGSNILTKKFVTPAIDKMTKASIAFETSTTASVLKYVPLVGKVVATPGKVLDVMAQFRSSRAGIKGIRNEMMGQRFYSLGHNKKGDPNKLYTTFERLNVIKGADGSAKMTKFGRMYKTLTGKTWEAFDKKHDLNAKALMKLHEEHKREMQHLLDIHNRAYAELGRIIFNLTQNRANAAKELAEKLGLPDTNSYLVILRHLKETMPKGMGKSKEDEYNKVLAELRKLRALGVGKDKEIKECLSNISDGINKLEKGASKAEKEQFLKLKEVRDQLWNGIVCEKAIKKIMVDGTLDQAAKLDALLDLAKKGTADKDRRELIKALEYEVAQFRLEEGQLRNDFPVYFDKKKNMYSFVEEEKLRSMIAEIGQKDGAGNKEILKAIEDKYGAGIAKLVESPEIYNNILGMRTASSGSELKTAIAGLKTGMGASLSAGDNASLDKLAAKYGASGKLSAKESAEITGALEKMQSVAAKDKAIFQRLEDRNNDMIRAMVSGKLLEMHGRYMDIADRLNGRLKGEDDIRRLEREGCSLGASPLALPITAILKKMLGDGYDENMLYKTDKDGKKVPIFTDINILDQYFGKVKTGAAEQALVNALINNNKELHDAAAAGKNASEIALKSIMMKVLNFTIAWNVKNYAATEILHNGGKAEAYLASYNKAMIDIKESGTFKTNLKYLRGEKPQYRQELGFAQYNDKTVESLLFTARGWDKLSGFVVSHMWEGTSRGEQVLGLYKNALQSHEGTVKMYREFFNNLTSKESVFYDKKFAEKMEKEGITDFNDKAYKAILERGYRWGDKKNGMEILISADRKAVPLLEYEQKYMPKQNDGSGAKDCIVREGQIVNYAPLLARTMGSEYSSREVGFVNLKNVGTEDKPKWVYASMGRDENIRNVMSAAEKQLSQRGEIMERLAGAGGEPSPMRTISTRDFITQSRKNKEFFGEYQMMDKLREGIRAYAYGKVMKSAEYNYGAFSDRLDKMSEWYAGQWQLRQALDRLTRTMGEEMTEGKNRFKYSEESVEEAHKLYKVKKIDASLQQKLADEMKNLEQGKDTSIRDSQRAWAYRLRGMIASSITNEIGDAETSFHNIKLELRALERLHSKGKVDDATYNQVKTELVAAKDGLRQEYKEAKKEYGDFNRMLIGWTGSHSNTYNPNRTLLNMGIVSKMLDSRFVQGTNDAFYQITESSVMRDPRVAIGASAPGWEHSYYVGYHTGQNVYERARFWATNSMWEQQMHMGLNIAYAVHKWWNDKVSFMSRYASSWYPPTVKSDMMYAPETERRGASDYFKALFIVPFQSRTYSDFFKARLQDSITFSGVGHMLAAHQSLGGYGRGEEGRSWTRKMLDKMGSESPHYFGTPFHISGQDRLIDKVGEFDKFIDAERSWKGERLKVKISDDSGKQVEIGMDEARKGLIDASTNMDFAKEEQYRKAIFDAIGGAVKLSDKRGRYIKEVFAGSDISEDGSRNRFLDMYIMFHSNVFTPTIPGMLQAGPLAGSNEWHSFPQVARQVESAKDKSALGMTKNYWEGSYDKESDRITFVDKFSTRLDSVAEAYKNDMPLLMHLMKMQDKEINYSLLNSQSIYFLTPSLVPAIPLLRGAYKAFVHSKWADSVLPGTSSLRTTMDDPLLSNRYTAKLFRGQTLPKHGAPDKYEYPSNLYKATMIDRMGAGTIDVLSSWMPGSWKRKVRGKARRVHHHTGTGRLDYSDENMAESFEMLLSTGVYSDYDE